MVRTCSKMRWSGAVIWQTRKVETVVQSFNSLLWMTTNSRKEELCISRRELITNLLTKCFEMLVLGTNWKSRHSLVCQQTCKSSHKMDSGMWQTIGNTEKMMKNVDFDEPTSFLDHVNLGCTQRECKLNEIIEEEDTQIFDSRISAGATANFTRVWKASRKKLVAWSYGMEGHARKCVEVFC